MAEVRLQIPQGTTGAMAIFLTSFGAFAWGMYQVGQGNKIRRAEVEMAAAEGQTVLQFVSSPQVYQQSIAAVCNLDWPRSNIVIQVLDDSDDALTRALIREEIGRWQHNGVNIVYRQRELRQRYMAGNLKSAMSCNYVRDYEFVAIFDADFQPAPDFLKKTIPHFKDNEEVGLVQARWSFVNREENLLTRLQYINLCFHFEVEQQVNGVFLKFFGFYGTRPWRIPAGGWRGPRWRAWTSPSGLTSRIGNSYSMTSSASVSYRSRSRPTGSSSTGGIPDPCSCSGCACRP